jgi:hypothetical protein
MSEQFTSLWDVAEYPNAPGLLVVRLHEVLCWRDWYGIVHKEIGHPPFIVQAEMPTDALELRTLVEVVKARLVVNCYTPYGEVREVWWEAPVAVNSKRCSVNSEGERSC